MNDLIISKLIKRPLLILKIKKYMFKYTYNNSSIFIKPYCKINTESSGLIPYISKNLPSKSSKNKQFLL